ncbi:MAG: transketolase [candidate division WOR-3 bacterium]
MSFDKPLLSEEELKELDKLGKLIRGDILKMTTLAQSGHPGGSMSSCDIYLVVWKYANVNPQDPDWEDRDRIIVSHGHTSPGVYAVLGRLGFFDIDDAISYFRLAGSPFEGHIEREVPGVEWTTGNLGQGLSAGVGFALASKITGKNFHVFVLMSDAEQAKGQVAEARRIAKKFGLNNITVIVDYNRKQISGNTFDVMPVNIKDNYISDGWKVLEVDGHSYQDLYSAIRESINDGTSPYCIIAHTVMGKGVSFMENMESYHGKPLNLEEYRKAIAELGQEDNLEYYKKRREEKKFPEFRRKFYYGLNLKEPEVKVYSPNEKVATRVAVGAQLFETGKLNFERDSFTPIAVFDCDLAESLRFIEFQKAFPHFFFEMGVQEHSTATVAGALSTQGVISVFGDFGVFGIDETYNQHRLNDINHTNLKLVLSHIGIDVGEDGKTHHCIDYIGLLRNLFGFKLIIPADGNQAKKAFNFMMKQFGNYAIAVGRSNWPIITTENGEVYYDEHYTFTYGKADILRSGKDATLIVYGATTHKGLEVYSKLKEKGVTINVINISTPFALDEELLLRNDIISNPIFIYEDHNVNSGLGTLIADFYASFGVCAKIKKFGLKNYAVSGKADDLYKIYGLTPDNISAFILEFLNKRV